MSQREEEKIINDIVKDLEDSKSDIVGSVATSDAPEITGGSPDFDSSVGGSDSFNSNGYNPNITVPTGAAEVPRENVRVPQGYSATPQTANQQPGAGAAVPPVNKKEGAPDVGKDYGDGLGTPGYNSVNNSPGTSGGATPSSPVPERKNPVDNPVPNETPETKHQGLDKKDGLDSEQDQGLQKKDKGGDTTDPKGEAKDKQAPAGNGYGALNNQNRNGRNPQDATSRARRNAEHNNQVRQGKDEESPKKKTSGTPRNNNGGRQGGLGSGNSPFGSLGARLRNGLNGLGKGNGSAKEKFSPTGKENKGSKDGSFSNLARKALEFIVKHPYAAIAIGVVIIIFLILVITNIENEMSGKKGTHCTYNLKGVSTSGEVKLEGLQVELINCDGTASNYTVLETVDFEKYVLGVALAEIGPSSPDEAIKAQIVAARGFALTRNSGMCPGNQDGCFYGYNASTGKIRMRACEADQVYWDYDKDIYRQDRGAISVYSPEINSGSLWKSALDETTKEHVLQLANEVKGKVLVDSTKNVVSTNYVASTSSQFISLANEGKNYEEILSTVYTNSDGFSSGECSSYGNIDYGDYVLSSDGHEILHQPIDSFLRSKGTSLEEFNSLIESNVEKAGYGTRAGVVAAAVTLIGELGNNYNVKVPYFWGGGHFDGVVVGALNTWGTTQCHTYANNTSYNYCGLDCSGFVSWAVKNGGFSIGSTTNYARTLPNVRKVTLSNSAVMEPGDLLESDGHVILIIGIEESTGNYICAEASGNSAGVLFTRRPFNCSGYWGVDMEGFYETHVRSK